MRTTTVISLSFVTVAAASPYQLQTLAPSWESAGKQGCISASSNTAGAPAVIHDCNTGDVANHPWDLVLPTKQAAGPQQVKVFGNKAPSPPLKCLDVVNGVNTDGAKVQIWDCVAGNANQLWTVTMDGHLQWAATSKCLDLPSGSVTDGTQLQIWTCADGNSNQRWWGYDIPNKEYVRESVIATGHGPKVPESNKDGAAVSLARCGSVTDTFPAGNQTWVFPVSPLTGPIKTYGGSKCLDVRGGSDTNGTPLQIWSCVEGSTNQQWAHLRPYTSTVISWAGKNKCVDITNGNWTAGNHLQIWDCDPNNTNQWWS
ncbi:hypothetical protein E1B28_012026 [Marasmius oreades]|uniref:Ricin B lectin domain-containing protein n=1 Tax=Marasmius oreades TaxID=181124 RepID=A0A9P7RQT4_9AGAR|nr:uncharacterized protein E1B28_012026 [Marasmius oreades]KAG7087987.1 hypothetical protein E1B28_012026 [Marasmius oreades]